MTFIRKQSHWNFLFFSNTKTDMFIAGAAYSLDSSPRHFRIKITTNHKVKNRLTRSGYFFFFFLYTYRLTVPNPENTVSDVRGDVV